jgi:hypothetical protein
VLLSADISEYFCGTKLYSSFRYLTRYVNFSTNHAVYVQKLECPYTKNTYILLQLPAIESSSNST